VLDSSAKQGVNAWLIVLATLRFLSPYVLVFV